MTGEQRDTAMRRRAFLRGAAAMAGAAALAACGGATIPPTVQGRIGPPPTAVSSVPPKGPTACTTGMTTAVGSTALQPLLDAAAKAYSAKCAGAMITVRGGGSGTGLLGAQEGRATVDMMPVTNIQIGSSDIFAEDQRNTVQGTSIAPGKLTDFQVVVQAFAIVVSAQNPLVSLTPTQLRDIFTGRVTNFGDVGGPKQAITVINRESGSGTRATFEQYGLGRPAATAGSERTSTGEVVKAITGTAGAIGYVGLASLTTNKDIKAVLLDGREPSVENISDDSYPIWSYGHLYTRNDPMNPNGPTGLTKAFLDYLLSDDVQTTLVPQLGYIPVSRVKARKTP